MGFVLDKLGNAQHEIARSETETLRERINSGFAEARRQGKRLERPPGSKRPASAFLAAHKDAARLLKEGHSRSVARLL